MNTFSVHANIANFGMVMAELQLLEDYQNKGYIPVKYEDEKFLTSVEKSYIKLSINNQKYFLQPPNF